MYVEEKLSEPPRLSGGNARRRRAWSGGGVGLLLALAATTIALGAWFVEIGVYRHGNDDAAGAVNAPRVEALRRLKLPTLEIAPTKLAQPRYDSGNIDQLLAAPFPLGSDETLFLFRVDGTAIGERVNWRTGETTPVPIGFHKVTFNWSDRLRRYSIATTSAGTWVAGPVLALIRPDGTTLFAEYFREDGSRKVTSSLEEWAPPQAVGLVDGSLLVVTKPEGERVARVERIHLSESSKTIEVQLLAGVPVLNRGMGITRLRDGRVLVAGGRTTKQQAWLYDPVTDQWTETGHMLLGRGALAIAALPDGRAFVAGSDAMDFAPAYRAELWDPASGSWQLLPNLPLSVYIRSDYAELPTATVLPDNSLVLAGAAHDNVMVLRARGKGFADRWAVVGNTSEPRLSGVVQALSDHEVVVSGGVKPVGGYCCRFNPGGERIAWQDDTARSGSLGLGLEGSVVLHRGGRTFVAGGRQRDQASAFAEMVDDTNGTVRVLAPLPWPLMSGTGIWMDEDRILVKTNARLGAEGFLALYSLQGDAWTSLNDQGIEGAEIADAVGNTALLFGPSTVPHIIDIGSAQIRNLPPPISVRRSAVARLLSNGQIVIAGGHAKNELFKEDNPDCSHPGCPVTYIARGPLVPATWYELFDPKQGNWQPSQRSEFAGNQTTIRADGRVAQIARSGDSKWLVVQSDMSGQGWRQIAVPEETIQAMPAAHLLAAMPKGSSQDVLFLRTAFKEEASGVERHDLWALDDGTGKWIQVAKSLTEGELNAQPMAVGGIVRGVKFRDFEFWQGNVIGGQPTEKND